MEGRDGNEIKMRQDNVGQMPLVAGQPQHTGGAISLPHYQWSLIIRVNRSLDRWRSMRKVSVSSTKGKSAAEIKGIFPRPYPAATLGICLTKIPFMRHDC